MYTGTNVVALSEARDESVFGLKAVQLGEALRAGLPVPIGYALPVVFVEAVTNGNSDAAACLIECYGHLRAPLAVRSSAVGEDSVHASFAGQHLTRLGVRSPDSLISAVKEIAQSATCQSALAYRDRLGICDKPQMGAVIQELIESDRAGVLFTRNPFDDTDERIIEASWGLCEAIVAGLVVPDRYRINRSGKVTERKAGRKDRAFRVHPAGGTEEFAVNPGLVDVLCLSDSDLLNLHQLAAACEQCFVGAHDLEWAYCGTTLYLLQRRAIRRNLDLQRTLHE